MTNEPTGPAGAVLRPGPLFRVLALLALLLSFSTGHTASVASGSDDARALEPDTDRIGRRSGSPPDADRAGQSQAESRTYIRSDRIGRR